MDPLSHIITVALAARVRNGNFFSLSTESFKLKYIHDLPLIVEVFKVFILLSVLLEMHND
jgi:hypothetical protein